MGGANLPIITLTAHAFEKEREKILAAGCDDCIVKPYDENVLFSALTTHLGVQFAYNEKTDSERQGQISSSKSLASEALAGLPESLLTELRAVAAELNQQRSMDCIEHIRIQDDKVADALLTLAKNFHWQNLRKKLRLLGDKVYLFTYLAQNPLR